MINLFNNKRRFFISASFYITILSLIVFYTDKLSIIFQYDRDKILNGDYYRLITGHLTHFSYNHLFWDLSVFLFLSYMLEYKNKKNFLIPIIISAISISLWMLFFRPDILFYRGLSGIDSTLFSLSAFFILKERYKKGDFASIVIILFVIFLFIVKIYFEKFNHVSFFVQTNFTVIYEAHLIGFLAGSFYIFNPFLKMRCSKMLIL